MVSCTADLCLWDEDILREIEKKTSGKKGVKFVFLVGPNINNTLLQKLAEGDENILLRILEDNPPCDFRVIDRNGTYVSNHGYDDPQRNYYRTFGSVVAVRDRLNTFNQLFAQSSEYKLSA